MKTILESWLKDHVGIIVDFDEIVHLLKDGMIFIRILKHYDAINVGSIRSVFPSEDEVVCKNNLLQLKIWFKLIDVDFSNDMIDAIIGGDSSVCLKILYRLFLVFNKGDLYLNTKQKERLAVRRCGELFRLSRTGLSDDGAHGNRFEHRDRVLRKKNIIGWYKAKHGGKEKSCDSSHTACKATEPKKSQSIRKKKKCSIDHRTAILKTESPAGSSEECYNGKLDSSVLYTNDFAFNKMSFLPPISPKSPVRLTLPPHVQRYLQKLKSSTGFSCRRKSTKLYSTLVMKNVWDKIVVCERSDLKNIIACKLIKQSAFEIDLTSRLQSILAQNEIQKQCYKDLENRIMIVKQSSSSLNSTVKDDYKRNEAERNSRDSDQDCDDMNCGGRFSYFCAARQRYISNDYNKYCLNEKKRTVDLHRKLYAENLKLRFERHYAICYHTIKDLIDLAIRRSEFTTENRFDIPPYIWHEWKCLFFHEQPIFDIVTDIRNKLYPDPSNFSHCNERVRQGVLNSDCLEMYLEVKNLWDVLKRSDSELNSESERQKYTIDHDSQIRLGYVVHRIMELKYPVPPRKAAADIPKYMIATVVNHIDDAEAVNTFRNLLMKADIMTIDVNTAVNFCLQCYKDHIGSQSFNVNQEGEGDFNSSSLEGGREMEEEEAENRLKVEFTQTTSSLFELNDGVDVKAAVKLGHKIFKMSLMGVELPFTFLVEIIIEYIKQYKDKIKGWVLVNFPLTLYQASIIEFGLSSKKFPYDLEDDTILTSDSELRYSVISNNTPDAVQAPFETEVKYSNIVPNPRTCNTDDSFKSYFSMYITTVKGTVYKNGDDIDVAGLLKEDSESTILLEQPEKEGVPTLYNFYKEQGIGYDFIYETFDLNTLKQLAQVILTYTYEDYKLQKLPEDMFDEKLLREFEPSVRLRWYSVLSPSLESSVLRMMGIQSLSDSNVVEDSTNTLLQELGSHSVGSDRNLYDVEEIGQKYADFPLLDEAALALSTFWESTETIYLNGIKNVFFLKRHPCYNTFSYISSITKQMEVYLNRGDNRQEIVTEFVDAYNSIHQSLRSDVQMKNELHLRVIELKERLIQLCAQNNNENKMLWAALVKQNWINIDLSLYANLFLSFIQIEIDRCIRTLQFLQDYYLAMLGNYNGQPLPNVKVVKIDSYKMSFEEVEGAEITGSIKEYIGEVDNSEVAIELFKSVIERMLNYEQDVYLPPLYLNTMLERSREAFEAVLKVKATVDGTIADREAAALSIFKEKDNTNKKKEKKPKTAESQPQESKDTVKENESKLKNLFEEWRTTVKNEIDRLSYRHDLLKKKHQDELQEIQDVFGTHFSEIYSKVDYRFIGESLCIDELCRLFQIAIEEKSPINAKLVFFRDRFYTIPDPVKPRASDIKYPAALEEMMFEESFTIKQLEAIKDRLMRIAPKGVLTQHAFVEFTESIIAYSSDPDNVRLVPKMWNALRRSELEILFQDLFGNYSLVEWRDFLICCLNLPFPLTEDIIDARLQFLRYDLQETEFIRYEDYMSTTLWFQRELPESPLHALRNVLAKEFIFSLYRRDDGTVNYMALLLSFCRDKNPKIGFGKALSLLSGRCVIVYEEDAYLERILTDHIDTELKIAGRILDDLLDDVVRNAMSGDHDTPRLVDSNASFSKTNRCEDSDADLTESMFHEFFRRHLVFQWTSKVPNAIVIALLCVTFYTLTEPDHIFLYPNVFDAVREHTLQHKDSDVHVPEFLKAWWIEMMIERIHKFNAYSLTGLIKQILPTNSTVATPIVFS